MRPGLHANVAEFGAEVINRKPRWGDDTRHYEHAEIGGESAAFLSLNRNKRGIALDFNNPAALEVARELIAKADVVVEKFSGGIMKKFGLDYASVAPANPKLIYCSISAYGRKGEFALRPGFDPITQAESGFMSLNGFPDGEPVRTGPPIVDMATGMSACNAILLALIAATPRRGHRSSRADRHRVTMTGFYGRPSGQRCASAASETRERLATVGSIRHPTGRFNGLRQRPPVPPLVVDVLDRPDLVTDPEFAHRKNRTANKEKLRAIIAGVFASDSLEHWMAKMKKANIPVGYLRTVEEGFNAPEVRDRHRLSRIPHPTAGAVPNIETPLQMSLTPTVDPVAAPLLGQHTNDVLRKTLGYDERRIAALAEAGAFGKPPIRPGGGDQVRCIAQGITSRVCTTPNPFQKR